MSTDEPEWRSASSQTNTAPPPPEPHPHPEPALPASAWQQAADAVADVILVLDVKSEVIVHVNRAVETLFGYAPSEVIGQTTAMFTPGNTPFRSNVRQAVAALETRPSLRVELQTQHRDGRQLTTEHIVTAQRDQHGQITHLVSVVRDLTQRSKAEQQRRRESRLDPVGALAGGIAHDFNNYLAAILGNVSLANAMLGAEHPSSQLLDQAERACKQARSLTAQLLTFSRGGSPVRQAALLEQLVRDCAEFALRGSAATCSLELDPELWPVIIDPGQVGSALHNLLVNAVQAMSEGGTIRIEAINSVLGPSESSSVAAGRYVRLSITDQGIGIPDEELDKIFDPYFTMKGGAGLGLTACARIVRQLGGDISVRSQVGVGTSFEVLLPAAPLESLPATAPLARSRAATGGRVLLMDDEEAVREVAESMMKHLGWEVVTAQDGVDAVAAFKAAKEQGQPFDLVIVDLTVPGGVGGKETLARLRVLDPQVKVVASSGYSDDQAMSNPKSLGFVGTLPKPYDMQALGILLGSVAGEGQSLV